MGTISYTIPVAGSTLNSVADPEIATALQTILTWANGNVDAVNLSNALAQSACVNESGQTVKGSSIISTSQTTTSTSFTTLSTPDQVTGITVGTGGLLAVQYQALWAMSSGLSQAAIFIGSNQLKVQAYLGGTRGPALQAAGCSAPGNFNMPLFTFSGGLASVLDTGSASYSADVTTGQAVGFATTAPATAAIESVLGTTYVNSQAPVGGGWCLIDNLPAGTYAVSVQFKANSGDTITALNRRLRVMALSFA